MVTGGYVKGRLKSKTLASRFGLLVMPQATAEKWVKTHLPNVMPTRVVVPLEEVERAAKEWASWKTQARKLQQA
jgi:hypothetical protein